ncbi:hypothetical protein CEXT_456141 [Caerostris extrusa]|uniref:LAGLIDADG homing endonuclease n=1 Tax=Caerostris extrusa TaxID=172846 RepID=A0AAV4RVM1_CAEEX|nr:hypothetical protein CEXT_456141 [Caerostris extrusa]
MGYGREFLLDDDDDEESLLRLIGWIDEIGRSAFAARGDASPNCRVSEIVLRFALERSESSNVNQSRCLDKILKRIDRRSVTFLYTKERGRQTRVIDELVKRDLTRLTRGHAKLIASFAQSPAEGRAL